MYRWYDSRYIPLYSFSHSWPVDSRTTYHLMPHTLTIWGHHPRICIRHGPRSEHSCRVDMHCPSLTIKDASNTVSEYLCTPKILWPSQNIQDVNLTVTLVYITVIKRYSVDAGQSEDVHHAPTLVSEYRCTPKILNHKIWGSGAKDVYHALIPVSSVHVPEDSDKKKFVVSLMEFEVSLTVRIW